MPLLDPQCVLVGCARITRAQALAFTANHPIGRVAGMIYDVASALHIDPAFALAEAILETGWGTSAFAQRRHNWYGYQAYYGQADDARAFATDEEGIRIPLQDMAHNYFTPGGPYYAEGAGTTLTGWAEAWVDGPPAHWESACRDILALMEMAMKMPSPPA
jgi:hypothetical protein